MKYYTIDDMYRQLGVTKETLEKLIDRKGINSCAAIGKLPAYSEEQFNDLRVIINKILDKRKDNNSAEGLYEFEDIGYITGADSVKLYNMIESMRIKPCKVNDYRRYYDSEQVIAICINGYKEGIIKKLESIEDVSESTLFEINVLRRLINSGLIKTIYASDKKHYIGGVQLENILEFSKVLKEHGAVKGKRNLYKNSDVIDITNIKKDVYRDYIELGKVKPVKKLGRAVLIDDGQILEIYLMEKPEITNGLFSTGQMSELLGISEKVINNLKNKKIINCCKVLDNIEYYNSRYVVKLKDVMDRKKAIADRRENEEAKSNVKETGVINSNIEEGKIEDSKTEINREMSADSTKSVEDVQVELNTDEKDSNRGTDSTQESLEVNEEDSVDNTKSAEDVQVEVSDSKDIDYNDLYRVKEVAELIGVSRSTICEWVRERILVPSKIINGKSYFVKDDIIKAKKLIKFRKANQYAFDLREDFTRTEISILCGISVTKLAYWEELGILVPQENKKTKRISYNEDNLLYVSEYTKNIRNALISKDNDFSEYEKDYFCISDMKLISEAVNSGIIYAYVTRRFKPMFDYRGVHFYSFDNLKEVYNYLVSNDYTKNTDKTLFSSTDAMRHTGLSEMSLSRLESDNIVVPSSSRYSNSDYYTKEQIAEIKDYVDTEKRKYIPNKLYRIKDVKRITGYNVYKLAIFECAGIIKATTVEGSVRYYDEEQVIFLRDNDCEKIYDSIPEEERGILTLGKIVDIANVSIPQIDEAIREGKITPMYYNHSVTSYSTAIFSVSQTDDIKKCFEGVERWFNEHEAAKMVGLTSDEVYLAAENGDVEYIKKYNSKYYFSKEQVNKLCKLYKCRRYRMTNISKLTGINFAVIKRLVEEGRLIPAEVRDGVNYFDDNSLFELLKYKNGLPSSLDVVKGEGISSMYVYDFNEVVKMAGLSNRNELSKIVNTFNITPVVRGCRYYFSAEQVEWIKKNAVQ